MTDKTNMSLDDIIKMNKKSKANTNKPRNTRIAQSKIRPKIQSHRPGPKQTHQVKDNGQTLLHVSNLHYKVTNTDLKELFNDVGPTKKAAVHYDQSGRSLGTAEVIFWTRDAALKAIKKYNSRILDGRPMSITLVPSSNSISPIAIKSGSGIKKRQSINNNRSPKKGNLPNKGRRTRPPKKEVTVEELNADLDSYKMSVDS